MSKAQLERGARLVELLKQGLHAPMAVEEQVVSIFAGTNGYLDDIPVADVRRFETELLDYMRTRHDRHHDDDPRHGRAARRRRARRPRSQDFTDGLPAAPRRRAEAADADVPRRRGRRRPRDSPTKRCETE